MVIIKFPSLKRNDSNVKSKLKGDYNNKNAYSQGDIVLYSEQLWRADRNIDADATQVYSNHSSNAQSKEDEYDSTSQSYPTIEYIVRGDYTLGADSDTDHILIRAEKEQFEGTKPGDILTLKWNKYTTSYQAGLLPFNGDSTLTESLINGNHTIVNKVQHIIHIQSALSVPDAGAEITTDTCRATIAYRRTNDENEMTVYIKDVNGAFQGSGKIYANGILIGDYEESLNITDNYHSGWWYVSIGSTFSSTNLTETNANLVIQDITPENEIVNNPFYYNNRS